MKICRSEGELRAYLDGELPVREQAALQAHLEVCADCQALTLHLASDRDWVGERLATLSLLEEAPPETAQAWAQLNEKTKDQSDLKARMPFMSGELFRRMRPAAAVLVLVLVIVVAFSFEPVRVAAEDFLSIFRVSRFSVMPVDDAEWERMEELGSVLEQNFFLGEPVMVEESAPQLVSTVEEAAGLAGFAVRAPEFLPEGFELEEIQVSGRGYGHLPVDLESARAMFEMLELDPSLLPDSLGRAPLEIAMSPLVFQTWRYRDSASLILVQGPSPTVGYPDDVDPAGLAAAVLQLLGMEEDEAQRLSESVDWTNTLVLPIPADIVSFQEVTIDGVAGLLLSETRDERGASSALMWQNNDLVYFLEGTVSVDTIMDIALSLE